MPPQVTRCEVHKAGSLLAAVPALGWEKKQEEEEEEAAGIV